MYTQTGKYMVDCDYYTTLFYIQTKYTYTLNNKQNVIKYNFSYTTTVSYRG